jgi:ribosomal protein L18
MNSTDRRKHRVRYALKAKANGKPRLSVFRSNKHIYAQVIDDINNTDNHDINMQTSIVSKSKPNLDRNQIKMIKNRNQYELSQDKLGKTNTK